MYGIALVATHRIIEIYHIKLYPFGVFFQILLKMIIHDGGQVRILEIIAIDRKSLVNLLFNKVINHSIRLAGTGGAEHNRGTKRIHHIYPSLVPFPFVIKSCGQIYRIFVVNSAGFLHKRFILIIEAVVHHVIFQHTARPYSTHQYRHIA